MYGLKHSNRKYLKLTYKWIDYIAVNKVLKSKSTLDVEQNIEMLLKANILSPFITITKCPYFNMNNINTQ